MIEFSEKEREEIYHYLDVGEEVSLVVSDGRLEIQHKKRSAEEKDFDIFWDNYPAKARTGKPYARKCWLRAKPDIGIVIKHLERIKKTERWSNPHYIPNPSTYINQERYNDEVDDGDLLVDLNSPQTDSQRLALFFCQSVLGFDSVLKDIMSSNAFWEKNKNYFSFFVNFSGSLAVAKDCLEYAYTFYGKGANVWSLEFLYKNWANINMLCESRRNKQSAKTGGIKIE